MNVFTIWREQSTGGLVLVAGDRPPVPGDVFMRRIDAKSWDVALAALHQLSDQQKPSPPGPACE